MAETNAHIWRLACSPNRKESGPQENGTPTNLGKFLRARKWAGVWFMIPFSVTVLSVGQLEIVL